MREDAEVAGRHADGRRWPAAARAHAERAFAVFDPSFHEGVVGIIASRLKDRLHRPTFVFALGQDGQLKGSGRSVEGLSSARCARPRQPSGTLRLLQRFGGHAMAAGCTIARPCTSTTFDSAFAARRGRPAWRDAVRRSRARC